MCIPVIPVTNCAAVITMAEHPKTLLIKFKKMNVPCPNLPYLTRTNSIDV